MTARKAPHHVIASIAEHLGGTLEHGAIFGGVLAYPGDLDVEIQVTVKRRVDHSHRSFYEREALSLLLSEPRTCDHTAQNRGPYAITKTKRCGTNISGVIVYRSVLWRYLPPGHEGPHTREYGYDYVCSVHLRHTRYAPVDVIETISFSDTQRAQIRAAKARRDAEWSAECRKRDEIDAQNERRAALGLPALPGGWRR